jgi:hypothetical protein
MVVDVELEDVEVVDVVVVPTHPQNPNPPGLHVWAGSLHTPEHCQNMPLHHSIDVVVVLDVDVDDVELEDVEVVVVPTQPQFPKTSALHTSFGFLQSPEHCHHPPLHHCIVVVVVLVDVDVEDVEVVDVELEDVEDVEVVVVPPQSRLVLHGVAPEP